MRNPQRPQKERNAKTQLANHIKRSWSWDLLPETGENGTNSQTTYVPDGTTDFIIIIIIIIITRRYMLEGC
jgi:hypothetical protein